MSCYFTVHNLMIVNKCSHFFKSVMHCCIYILYFSEGLNVETISHGKTKFVTWDVGGRDKIVSNHKLSI